MLGFYTLTFAAVAASLALTTDSWALAGDLDTTFGTGGIVVTPMGDSPGPIRGLVLQPGDKIVAVGTSRPAGDSAFTLVRYDVAGTVDPTFGSSGVTTTPIGERNTAFAATSQVDGKIIVVGHSFQNGSNVLALARYAPDGALDGSFGNGSGTVSTPIGTGATAYGVAVQADGKIVVAGDSLDGGDIFFTVVRYSAGGTLDSTFGSGGIATPAAGNAFAVAIQPDGKIVAAGRFLPGPSQFGLVRLNSNGTPDATFGTSGLVSEDLGPGGDDEINAVALQSDGKIVVAGYTTVGSIDHDFAVARYDATGALDPTFGPGGIVTTSVSPPTASSIDQAFGVAVQPDGKVLAAGRARNDFGVARYLPDGSPDIAFAGLGKTTTDIGSSDHGYALALQEGGRFVVAGDGLAQFALARYVGQVCGNGFPEFGELCDDGVANGSMHSCCGEACDFLPDGTECDDGSACTLDDTCSFGVCQSGGAVPCTACEACEPDMGCVPAPRPNCRKPTEPAKAQLLLKNDDSDDRDQLNWKWKAGELTPPGALGDPLTTDDYAFCIYDESGPAPVLVLRAVAPAGGTCDGEGCWQISGGNLRYRDVERTPDGIELLKPRAGEDGDAKVLLKGKGSSLSMPLFPLPVPLLAQMHVADACWEATYSAVGVQRNDEHQFKGKAD